MDEILINSIQLNRFKEQEDAIAKELLERDRATPTFTYGFYSTRSGELCTLVTNTVAIRPFGWKKALYNDISFSFFFF